MLKLLKKGMNYTCYQNLKQQRHFFTRPQHFHFFAASHVHADETSNWAARSVDQIKADIAVSDKPTNYTVQYGDTLGSIAEAMGIDVNVFWLTSIKSQTLI